jgi:hypothetical protein
MMGFVWNSITVIVYRVQEDGFKAERSCFLNGVSMWSYARVYFRAVQSAHFSPERMMSLGKRTSSHKSQALLSKPAQI